MTKVHRKWF